MLSALQTSLTGLLSASNRAKLAAENIVRASSAGTNALEATDVVSAGKAYGDAVVIGSNPSNSPPPPAYGPVNQKISTESDSQPGIVESIVDLKLAAQAYKANATAIRTTDETLSGFIKEI
jgi:flagellar basal body rod protein FlgC